MRPYYPFKSKLFNTTIQLECPNINDTLSVKACMCKRRQFSSNGAASIQKIHTVQRTSSPWWVVWVIHTVIFTHLFDSESGKNSNFEGSKQEEIDTLRLRDHFDFVLVRSLILLAWLDGIIFTPGCVLKMFNRRMPTLVQWTIHDVILHMPMCPDFDAVAPWLKCIGDEIWCTVGIGEHFWWAVYSGMIITIPSLVLFCDHFMSHVIKYKGMVKVEKISPQQAQSQLQLLNAIAMMIILKVRNKALQVNDTLW